MIITQYLKENSEMRSTQNFSKKVPVVENSMITKYYYQKARILSIINLILYIQSLLLSLTIFDYTYSKLDRDQKDNYPRVLFRDIQLIYSSIIAFILIINEFLIVKFEIKMNLYQGVDALKCTFKNKQYWVTLLFFTLFCICHPNIFCEYYIGSIEKFTYFNDINNSFVTYSLNDVLSLLGLTQIFPILYHYCKNLTYNSDIASRCWFSKKQDQWVQKNHYLRNQMLLHQVSPGSDIGALHSLHHALRNRAEIH